MSSSQTPTQTPTQSLIQLTRSDAKIQQVAEHLDGLDQGGRLREMYALTSADQARLFDKAAGSPPLDLHHFVPRDADDLHEVIHYGKNSQPAFRMFQKRWCRPPGRDGELWGYNETMVRPVIGPGYFVAVPTEGDGSDSRGAVVVDYFRVPDGPAPAGWPAIKYNSQGLQKFVYNNTRDYMRRVSRHVSIGAAYRKDTKLMGYFILCRAEASKYQSSASV